MKYLNWKGALPLALVAALFWLSSCDKCEDNCMAGNCIDGDCVCDDGWEGLWCTEKASSGGGNPGGGNPGGGSGSPSKGQLMVWNSNSQPCPAGAGSTISVYIDGQYAGGLSHYYTTTPSCGASGAVTKTLSVGSHTVKGSCGTSTWGPKTVMVTEGGCYRLELY